MDIGIIGLPNSGKTTIFNAVTRGAAEVAAYSGLGSNPNLGVAKVPDRRLEVLEGMFKPKRTVPAELSYADLPGASDGSASSLIASEHLNHLQGADALLVVARAFEDSSVSHVEDSIDPFRDAETVLLELTLADLEILDRRLTKLDESSKGAKAPQRQAIEKERSLLERLKAALESGTAIRVLDLNEDETRALEGFQFLTSKPLVVAFNVGEDQTPEAGGLEARLSSAYDGPQVRTAVLCGTLEMELAQMEPADERQFRESLGAGESGLDRMIRLSHDVAGLITFFTGNPNEVRAWTIPSGTPALKAAGKIHSDFERGFIRAEVVGFDDLAECGSVAEARKRGLLRQEGKAYVVDEGDVVNVLFNV